MKAAMEQLSLFTLGAEPTVEMTACFDGRRVTARRPEPWELDIEPRGELVVMVDRHSLVLKPSARTVADIAVGHEFYHYTVGSQVYEGVFVGREEAS